MDSLFKFYIQKLDVILNKEQSVSDTKVLNKAFSSLHHRYVQENYTRKGHGFHSVAERIVYLHTRSPATFAVLCAIFKRARNEGVYVQDQGTFLDLGSGPGIGAIAFLLNITPQHIIGIEQDEGYAHASQQALSSLMNHCTVDIIRHDLKTVPFPLADFVLSSYVLTEMPIEDALAVYQRSLDATKDHNLVVLPGEPKAFNLLLQLREIAIHKGFEIIAPCPHAQMCPLSQSFDQRIQSWCHTRAHVVRYQKHQEMKKGTKGFEEEPYCYLWVKRPLINEDVHSSLKQGRIIHTPQKKTGHVYLDVCTSCGTLNQICVSKKDKEKYKIAKSSQWGDLYKID